MYDMGVLVRPRRGRRIWREQFFIERIEDGSGYAGCFTDWLGTVQLVSSGDSRVVDRVLEAVRAEMVNTTDKIPKRLMQKLQRERPAAPYRDL